MTEDEQAELHDRNEPRYHKCENCDQPLPESLEGCHCDDDANWFCGGCWIDLQSAGNSN
jgi:Zn finger protein HypA/HybF involved in hydrogenase expression